MEIDYSYGIVTLNDKSQNKFIIHNLKDFKLKLSKSFLS